jgi:NAD(P)-dependent dehydrogenase (short-subunit alcohol dehydrogenase family)
MSGPGDVVFRSGLRALERVPADARKSAWRALEGLGRRIPRGVMNAPLGGRVPLVRPKIGVERLRSKIDGRRVLITGATSGIGLETAHAIGRAGGDVILVARNKTRLNEVAAQVDALGGRASIVPGNLSESEAADQIVESVCGVHGGVDILINNAGHSIRRPLAASYDRDHDFERTMALNYFGAVRLILGFLPGMRERGDGHIINVSTMGVEVGPEPRFSAYLASKAALDAFTASAAPETAQDGIAWTTVYMPLVRTQMIAPTAVYQRVPALSPGEASQLLLEAIVGRPRYVSTAIGRFGALLYQLSPSAIESLFNLGFRLVPDEADDEPKGKRAKRKQVPAGP